MALKDLVVSHAELTEEQIEKIIGNYLRFDTSAETVVLLPSTTSLSSRQRILLYLVGLRGWPFVKPDDTPPTAATPSELEAALQIPGGTLRPILKELKETRLVSVADGRYSVNPVTLPFIEREIANSDGTSVSNTNTARPRKKRKSKSASASEVTQTVGEKSDNVEDEIEVAPASSDKKFRKRRDASAKGGPIVKIRELITEGWFGTPRTVQDILDELRVRGTIYKRTDLTRQMIMLTRARELRRQKQRPAGAKRDLYFYSNW